jgi:hypothetical protein
MRGSLGFPISASRLEFLKRFPHRFCQADAARVESTYPTIAGLNLKILSLRLNSFIILVLSEKREPDSEFVFAAVLSDQIAVYLFG